MTLWILLDQEWILGLLPFAVALLVVALVDMIVGAALAWQQGSFDVEQLPRFLQNLGLYVLAWLAAEILAYVPVRLGVEIPGWAEALSDVAPKAVFGLIAAGKYAGSIVNNIRSILWINNAEPWSPEDTDE
jgi:hypothetical protein